MRIEEALRMRMGLISRTFVAFFWLKITHFWGNFGSNFLSKIMHNWGHFRTFQMYACGHVELFSSSALQVYQMCDKILRFPSTLQRQVLPMVKIDLGSYVCDRILRLCILVLYLKYCIVLSFHKFYIILWSSKVIK